MNTVEAAKKSKQRCAMCELGLFGCLVCVCVSYVRRRMN